MSLLTFLEPIHAIKALSLDSPYLLASFADHSFLRLVLKWHPDKNRGKEKDSQVQTAKLNNAYEILGDADERKRQESFHSFLCCIPTANLNSASEIFGDDLAGES